MTTKQERVSDAALQLMIDLCTSNIANVRALKELQAYRAVMPNVSEAIEPEILEPEPVYHGCKHEPIWNTCRECNEDFCKDCWERHECYI